MMNRSAWLVMIGLLFAMVIGACAAPLIVPAVLPVASTLPTAQGIDPTLPHAQSVLMQSCVEAGCELRLIDPASGEMLPGYAPIDLDKYATYTLAHDGQTLAMVLSSSNNFGPGSGPTDGFLQLIDLQTWQAITTTLRFNEGGAVTPAFSPDGTRLALVGFSDAEPSTPLLHLVDVNRQTEIAQIPLQFRPSQMKFTGDGRSILLYGNDVGVGDITVNPQVFVAKVNTTDLTVEWQSMLQHKDGFYNAAGSEPYIDPANSFTWQPAVVFAPDASRLYVVHADENQVTTVDFDQHRLETTAIMQTQSWLERWLALSARSAKAKMLNGAIKHAVIAPDGKTLYVTGFQAETKETTIEEMPLGVQVIDLEHMVKIAQIDSETRSISISADGTRLYLRCWANESTDAAAGEWTEVVDTATFQKRITVEAQTIAVGQRLDGRPILFSTVNRLGGLWEVTTLDPVSLTVIHTWAAQEKDGWSWFVNEK
jgi:DNA-binding beta-propeller fold protein YncE